MTETKVLSIIGGTGNEGPGLALRWAKSGKYRVIIGSRQLEKAERVASALNEKIGAPLIKGSQNKDAAACADIAVLTVPYEAQSSSLNGVKDELQGKILINVTVPLKPPKVSVVYVPQGGSAAAEAQSLLGEGVRVVAAFQNISSSHLEDAEGAVPCDVLVCGDDKEAKSVAMELAEAAGMRGIDAGPLANAIVVEGLTSILIGINIRHKCKGAGILITGIEE